MNKYKVDFNKYFKPEEVSGYELFIGPSGEYYKVKTRYESDEDCTHYYWAEEYFKKNNLNSLLENDAIKSKCNTCISVLINYLGFIRYSHMYNDSIPYISLPNPNYFGRELTPSQYSALNDIMEYNNDYIDEDTISGYDSRVEDVFNRLTRR